MPEVSKPHSALDRARERAAHIDRYVSDAQLRADGELLSELIEQLQAALDREAGTSDALQEEIERATENGRLAKRLHEQLEAAQTAMRRARHELDQWVFADGSASYRVARAEEILDAALGVSSPASELKERT